MLGFFRKYQRYFFIVVTVVVIVSFSFFGTYNTIDNAAIRDVPVFVAIDGTKISRADLDQLVWFISTDMEDKINLGGMWGPNFLNDGVVNKDFIQTGLAQTLAMQYPGEIEKDLGTRLEKEKRYTLYSHPQAQFLNVENAWNYLAPDIKQSFHELRSSSSAVSPEAFKARTRLYEGEKKLPALALRRILLYQQQQYSWLTPDPNLQNADLSLFGYHTLDDWFGPRFLRLVAEFIINSSIIAEQRGYQVTKDEALADLLQNSEASFKQNASNLFN